MNYKSVIDWHAAIAAFALIAFWTAALTQKGSPIHRLAGKFYFAIVIVILLSVIPMIYIAVQSQNYKQVILLGYLSILVITASYVALQAIRKKKSITEYHNWVFKSLASALSLYGLSILTIGLMSASFLTIVFSSVGITLGASMWVSLLKKDQNPGWHLRQHMNGNAVIFAATHGSFLRLALKTFFGFADTPELNTVCQTSMIVLALLLRIWVGKMYFKNRKKSFAVKIHAETMTHV